MSLAVAVARSTVWKACSASAGTSVASAAFAPRRMSSTSNPDHGVYPGGKVIPFTVDLDFHEPSEQRVMPCYRVMNEDGSIRPDAAAPTESKEEVLSMYKTMVKLQEMDKYFNEAQRQGRISFYMQAAGEEAIHIGSASSLNPEDEVFAQYREAGVLMHRGFTLQDFADQCFSNCDDLGKGRQMPVHYGSRALHYQTISSPLATQIPQATGAAYALKMAKEDLIVCCFFGDGAASEGDFHAALNFAATLECPVVFFCRNNGFAISTPVHEQYRGDGIIGRGIAYGMRCTRIDGNDLFAVKQTVAKARELALSESKPVLIEAMTYREGHHSTSDDSSRYRPADEITQWRTTSNPVNRVRSFMENNGWWSQDQQAELVAEQRKEVLAALSKGESKGPPAFDDVFNDVYDTMTPALKDQKAKLEAHIAKYPDRYFVGGH